MALPAAADQVVIQGFLLDEVTAQGDTGQVSSEPVALTGQNAARPLVLARDSHVMIRTGKRVTTPRLADGYWALLALSTNDPDLDAYGGRKITLPDGSFRVIQVPYDAPLTTVSTGMASQVSGLTVGTQVRAVWYDQAAGYVTPTPPAAYYTVTQINSLLADLVTTIPETSRDAIAAALVAGSNVTILPNDEADTITISVTLPSSYSDEQAQDAAAALLSAGSHSGITFTYDDAGNAISAVVQYGTTSGTAVRGNDARLSDTRTPTDGTVTDAKVSANAAIAESKLNLASDAAASTASRRTLGTGAQQAAAGNDSRITGAAQSSSLAPVATSGSYADLSNKPVTGVSTVNSRAGAVAGLAEQAAVDAVSAAVAARAPLPEATTTPRAAALGTPSGLLGYTNRYALTAAITEALPPVTDGAVLAFAVTAGSTASLTLTASSSDYFGDGVSTSTALAPGDYYFARGQVTGGQGRWRRVSAPIYSEQDAHNGALYLPLNRFASSISAYECGARGDCYQPNYTVSTTLGQAFVSISLAAFPGLAAGMIFFIEGQGTYTVASVAATTVTFTSNLSATGTGLRCYYGTDNTSALNSFFSTCVSSRKMGIIGPGRYLITGTIGLLEPGTAISSQGTNGLYVLCGGAVWESMRLAKMIAGQAGTTFVWAGAVGGTMMQFSRVSFAHFQGGFSLAGMASSDPGGTFSTFGNRPGLGFHFSQSGTPSVGTGYLTLDQIVCMDMTQAMQFGTAFGDNNADTSLINRALIERCDDGIVIKHLQGLSYRFNWIHGISVTGSLVRSEGGGAVEIGSLHASLCGTATTGGATTDKYILDCQSSVSGYLFKVALFRIENGSVRAAATRSNAVHLQIDVFEEANNTNTKRGMFFQAGGTIQILGGRLYSYFAAAAGDERPIMLTNDSTAKAPRFVISDMSLPIFEWANLFVFDANTVADISVISPRNGNNVVGETRHSRLERGRVLLGGPTADAATNTALDPMMRLGGSGYNYSYGPRVPLGTSVIRVTVIGDRASNAPTVLKRRVTLYRASNGTVTVVSTETVGTDVAQGTDQITGITAAATTQVLNVYVKGTVSVTINWRAVLELEDVYAPAPDY